MQELQFCLAECYCGSHRAFRYKTSVKVIEYAQEKERCIKEFAYVIILLTLKLMMMRMINGTLAHSGPVFDIKTSK